VLASFFYLLLIIVVLSMMLLPLLLQSMVNDFSKFHKTKLEDDG